MECLVSAVFRVLGVKGPILELVNGATAFLMPGDWLRELVLTALKCIKNACFPVPVEFRYTLIKAVRHTRLG